MSRKILALVAEPISADTLRSALGGDAEGRRSRSSHPERDRNWAEDELVEQATTRFDLPVRQIDVSG